MKPLGGRRSDRGPAYIYERLPRPSYLVVSSRGTKTKTEARTVANFSRSFRGDGRSVRVYVGLLSFYRLFLVEAYHTLYGTIPVAEIPAALLPCLFVLNNFIALWCLV